MKNIYEIQLEELINECGLKFEMKSDSTEIHNILMDIFKTRCDGKKVALWGAGRKNEDNSHAAMILKKYTTYLQGMCCLIDSMPELRNDKFMGYPIIAPQDIKDYDVDIVIIASKVQADSIIKDLASYAPGCEYIDIYGELKERGMIIYHKFYEESNIYTTLYQLRKTYENESNRLLKEKKLKGIIAGYLSIQDFYYTKFFAKKYIDARYTDYETIQYFINCLSKMEKQIQDKNASQKDDIVIFFVDSLRAMDVYHKDNDGNYVADMLKSYIKDSVVFSNAKSTGVTTYESMISVVKQKYPYEQNVYENNILAEFDEFKLLPIVEKQGYDIKFYVSEGYSVIHESPKVDFVKQIYLSSKLWKLTTDMACEKRKSFNFVYVPYELHFPLICGYHREEPRVSGFVDVGVVNTESFVPRQLVECKDYVDKQYEYYYNWFSKDILMSFFADHSQVIFDDKEKKPYFMYYNNQDRCVNVMFLVKGMGLKQKWATQLVSLYDFFDIMKELIENRNLVIPQRDIARYQYYKIHYKKLREYAKEHNMEDFLDGVQCYTSLDYLCVITATGCKEVYEIANPSKNIFETHKGKQFYDYICTQLECDFPEFLKE